jgi:hypothetical protein
MAVGVREDARGPQGEPLAPRRIRRVTTAPAISRPLVIDDPAGDDRRKRFGELCREEPGRVEGF